MGTGSHEILAIENNTTTEVAVEEEESKVAEVADSSVMDETFAPVDSASQFLQLSQTSAPESVPFDFSLLHHVTFPDGSEVEPGTALTKTWRVRNTGTSCWPVGTGPVTMDSQLASSLMLQTNQAVSPGDEVDVSVQLKGQKLLYKLEFNFSYIYI